MVAKIGIILSVNEMVAILGCTQPTTSLVTVCQNCPDGEAFGCLGCDSLPDQLCIEQIMRSP